ncbi:MAG TPA: nucleotidyl transferase AbiEii/AbiGii toxin family protein [Conexibacter sp.]
MNERTPHQAYAALQRLAREQGRTGQQLFELYVHERFLARLAASSLSQRFVLKGGMLLAVLEVRRPTRAADLLARGLANDPQAIRAVVEEIATVPMPDGVAFDSPAMTIEQIREDADYRGARVKVPAGLAGAELRLTVDLSFGDPIVAQPIDYPTLLDDGGFAMLGYPLEGVIAEKAITMLTLGDANTRDRDYADVYLLSRIHSIEAATLRSALRTVAEHRSVELRPLGPQLDTLPESRQRSWTAFRARVGLDVLPERFADVVDAVVAFIDGLAAGGAARWSPADQRWVSNA